MSFLSKIFGFGGCNCQKNCNCAPGEKCDCFKKDDCCKENSPAEVQPITPTETPATENSSEVK